MAAPNIVDVNYIYAKTAGLAVTTSATAIVSNGASSGKVFKVNTLIISNISASSASVTVDVYKAQTTSYRIAYQISVPANSTLIVVGKGDNGVYLEESDSIRLVSATASALEAVCSYEDMST